MMENTFTEVPLEEDSYEVDIKSATSVCLSVCLVVCEVCGKSVAQEEYDKHLKTHKEKRIESCNICFKTFTNLSNFKYHMAHHSSERPWLCSECPKNYKTKIDLLQHQRVHDKARDPFRCETCGQLFRTRSTFNTHQRTHIPKGPQKCEICDKVFVNLRSHHQMVHEGVRQHNCKLCGKAFGKKSGLDRHVITVHQKLKMWSCDLCDKSFGEKAQLQRHQKVHFRPEYQIPDPEDIIEDQQVYYKNKIRMRCGICRKIVNSKAALKRHKLLVHENKREILCDFCPKLFGERANLRKHVQKHHSGKSKFSIGLEYPEDEDASVSNEIDKTMVKQLGFTETFPCPTCDTVLTTSWGFKAHEEVCLLKQQTKLNKLEESIEQKLEQRLSEPKKVEIVYLMNEDDESLEIKQEPYYDDETEESAARNINEPFHSSLKEEYLEEALDEDDDQTLEVISSSSVPVEVVTNKETDNELFEYEYLDDVEVLKSENNDQVSEEFLIEAEEVLVETELPTLPYWPPKLKCNKDDDKSDRTCDVCMKVFKKMKYMKMHKASVHDKDTQHICPICNRGFSFQRSMERHVRAIHEDRKDFMCSAEGCEKAFRSRYEVNEHYNNIHAMIKKLPMVEEVTCNICEKVCSSRKVLYSHKKMVHEGVKWGLKFECKLCKENFESKYKKTKHWGQVHRNGEVKVRTCHVCNTDFQLFEDYKEHIMKDHEGNYICFICGKDYHDESTLFIHSESHRKVEEELRQYICDICSHRLTTKAQLVIHMRKHFNGDYYICDVCGKSYKFIAPFLHHKMGHENRFDFPCRYCEKKFRVSRDRMLHERIHTKERPYKCYQCQKAFAHKANYVSHLKTHELKAHGCKLCGLQLSSGTKLRQHEDQEHPEERLFKCTNCPKSFKMMRSLELHKQKCFQGAELTDEKDFNCYEITYF